MARLSSNSSLTALRHPAALPTETQDQSIKDIFKCGICSVKLIKESELASTAYQRFWVVFYVLNEQAPILELFKKEQPLQNFNNQDSVAKYSLKNCHYVSIPILNSANDKENSNEFVISLDTQLLQICVDSQESNDKELLHEWVNCLREKLASLNVFSSQDNPYSKEPVNVIKKMSSRPPMPLPAARPLPPIPRQAALQFPPQIPLPSIPSEGQQELVTVASSSSSSQSNGHVTRQTNGQSRQAQVSRTMERILDRLNGTRSSPTENSIHSLYSTPNPNFSKFVTSISVNYGLPGASSSENNYESLAAAASSQQDIPRPSSSNCPTGSNGQQVLSLRESQIVTLRKEINNPGGVRLKIRKVDCVDSLALVEWLGRIFIAGWKQKVGVAIDFQSCVNKLKTNQKFFVLFPATVLPSTAQYLSFGRRDSLCERFGNERPNTERCDHRDKTQRYGDC